MAICRAWAKARWTATEATAFAPAPTAGAGPYKEQNMMNGYGNGYGMGFGGLGMILGLVVTVLLIAVLVKYLRK